MLDEAFKSRIHYKIYYPDLTLEQTLDIWKLNIQRVRRIEEELAKVENREPLEVDENELLAFAKNSFDAGGSRARHPGRWNGRQIRNAFQIARSLAYYEARLTSDSSIRAKADTEDNATDLNKASRDLLRPPKLDARHFKTVHEITASFDNYITAVHGGTTDAELALDSEYRSDSFRDNLTDNLQAEYRDSHRMAAATAADQEGFAHETDSGSRHASFVATFASGASNARWQRPRQSYATEEDGYGAVESFETNYGPRGSQSSRRDSTSRLASFEPTLLRQPMNFNSPSPMYQGASFGFARRDSPGGTYGLANTSPRPQPRYPNETGGMMPSRGSSPALGDGVIPLAGTGGGREYRSSEYMGPGHKSFVSADRESPGLQRSPGPSGLRSWSAGVNDQGYGKPYTRYQRNDDSKQEQSIETDLYVGEP